MITSNNFPNGTCLICVLSCVCPQDGSGKSKCFGFINFSEPEAAAKAVEELTGREVNGKSLYAGR